MLEQYKDVLTVKELREVLPASRKKTYDLLREGVVPSFRLGRTIYVPKEALIDFIRTQTTHSNTMAAG